MLVNRTVKLSVLETELGTLIISHKSQSTCDFSGIQAINLQYFCQLCIIKKYCFKFCKTCSMSTVPYKITMYKLNENLQTKWILCVLDRASSWYLNNGWPTRWHLLYYIWLNMFQTLICPSSGAIEYLLCCVGWLKVCWCYVAGLSVGDVVS